MRAKGWRRGVVGLVLVAVLGGTLGGRAPTAAAEPMVIGCDRAGERVVVTTDAVLEPGCTYTAGLDVAASDVTLDCRGAVIDGGDGPGAGILITAPVETDRSRIVVRNCVVRGFVNGIRATRVGFRTLAAGDEYRRRLADVTLEGNDVADSHGVGIFVDGYVTRVTIRDNRIHDAGSSGVYLEAGSADNVVVDNQITDNGLTENGPAGTTAVVAGVTFRYWGTGREGISVDGSRRNRIQGNTIAGNRAGGVFLYTNCGEYVHERPERWFERRYGADDNLIEGNTISDGPNGVWVGSRMGESTFPMDCSDRPYLDQGTERVVLDRAAGNRIVANHFTDLGYGVRVEDDRTVVHGNHFAGPDGGHHAVVVGTPYRTRVLGRPVTGTRVTDNVSTIVANPFPYRWVDGERSSTVTGNRALGRSVGWCRGEPPPRGPFTMVLAFAVDPPDGPPAQPPPDLTFPVLGPLAPCPSSVPPATTPTTGSSGTTTPRSTAPPAASPATPVAGRPTYTG